jgi:hypothetical protein
MLSRRSLSVAATLLVAATAPAQLAGTYVVGAGGTYPNLAAAIAALSSGGVVAPVTFYVTANDTGPWTIPAFAGQGPANPVVFESLGGPVTLGGAQPVLTLNGCASVTFRGFTGQFTNTTNAIVVAGSTTDCVFTGCDFRATVATAGVGVFNFTGGAGCRIEDSTFGGGWEALTSAVANSGTTVQRCRILGGGFRIMTIAGSDFTLVNNQITGTSNYGINGGAPGSPASAANLKIWHNTVHIVHAGTGTQFCTLRWYTSAPGTEVLNNVFVDETIGAPTTMFGLWCSGSLRPAVMDFNCFFSSYAGYTPVFAGANLTLAGWQALGFDGNSIQADPQLVAPSATPPDLSLQPGSPCATAGSLLLTVLTDFFLAPRTVPVSIGAHEQDGGGGGASYTVFGAGCQGSAGVVSNAMSQPPQLGTTPNLVFGNLPATNLAVAILGVSNTLSTAGPLPIPLAFLGMPGCDLRVSPDVTTAVVGSGGTGTLPFPIPNNPIFVGFTFHTQALALDPGINAFGASMSAAATAVVGP